ncbi:MAG TPA: sulfite exporter TauE/SafE family protein [Longimicrobiaceae bacterium]|nr:sulfite exporter TauE/SafE family protein [Longimicrobiaceae bacterium]
MTDPTQLLTAALAGVAAGAVNALAGGGTLITFPTLLAVGIPAVAANVTSTVALCPGYLGATLAQREDLRGQRRRLWVLLPASALGGVGGAVLLLRTDEQLFRALVPYLILLAAGLLAAQDPLRARLLRHAGHAPQGGAHEGAVALAVAGGAVYGGYFGAGLGVIVLAVLGLALDDSLTRLNALKQAVSLSVNVAAAVFFVFQGEPVWPVALVMAVGALLGGALGGRVAGHIRPELLRRVVVALGLAIGVVYLLR